MHAEILAIGTELVTGQKIDTNSAWLSGRLAELGIETRFVTILGDDGELNAGAFRLAMARSDVVLTTGGLGPTQDDLTREVLAEVAGVSLELDEGSLAAIRGMFARRGREMPARNAVQAMFPSGSEVLPNGRGTAPGIWMRVSRGEAWDPGWAWFACLPGVPGEMKAMFDEQVAPRLRALEGRGSGRVILSRTLNLFGRGEAEIEAEALDLTARGRRPEVGITASDATISFRIRAEGDSREEAEAELEATARVIRERFGDLVVGEGTDDVVEDLARRLGERGATIAMAESCTAGLASSRLGGVAGISAWFLGGVVSYSDRAKRELLGVSAETLERFGAVSAETAREMAIGARERLGSDLGVSITGIAGPGGGTSEKPVGLVWLGLATAGGASARELRLGEEQPRQVIRSRSAKHALNWARLHLARSASVGDAPISI